MTPGYYLVKDKDGSVSGQDSYTKFIWEVVGNDVSAKVKSSVPTSEKKVKDTNDTEGTKTWWQDSADYDIGDQVSFQLTGTVAQDYNDYKSVYQLVFHDTLSNGLTLDRDSFKVYKNDSNEVLELNQYEVNITDDQHFTVTIKDVKVLGDDVSKVRVEYTATLNENAVIGFLGNPNTMYMEFSNNPNNEQGGETDETGKTPEDTVIVFTYKVSVNKVNENNEKLDGAEFTLEKKHKVSSDKYEWKPITKVDGTAGDVFEFKGIDDGEYRLTETRAPANYDKLSDPIYFTVTAGHVDGANPYLDTFSGNITSGNVGEMAFTANKDTGILSTTIQNKPGSSLPETGGTGTTVLYAAGTLMILAVAAFLVMKKKAESK